MALWPLLRRGEAHGHHPACCAVKPWCIREVSLGRGAWCGCGSLRGGVVWLAGGGGGRCGAQ
jgi:hypothetical protein